MGDFFSIIPFICFLVALRVKPRIQRAIVFITVITIIMDMDITITLHGAHLPIKIKNVLDAMSKTWVILVGNESKKEESYSVSKGFSVFRGSLILLASFFCLGLSVISRDFVMMSHKLAKAFRLG